MSDCSKLGPSCQLLSCQLQIVNRNIALAWRTCRLGCSRASHSLSRPGMIRPIFCPGHGPSLSFDSRCVKVDIGPVYRLQTPICEQKRALAVPLLSPRGQIPRDTVTPSIGTLREVRSDVMFRLPRGRERRDDLRVKIGSLLVVRVRGREGRSWKEKMKDRTEKRATYLAIGIDHICPPSIIPIHQQIATTHQQPPLTRPKALLGMLCQLARPRRILMTHPYLNHLCPVFRR